MTPTTLRSLLVAVFGLTVVAVLPPPVLADRADSTVDYTIQARLDPELHTVNGRQNVHVVNRSARPLSSLTFHLYLNAFENDATLWMRESSGVMRGARIGDWGHIDVTALEIDGVSLLDRVRLDETLLHVPLPQPLPPGASLEVAMSFLSRLPSATARTGYARDFHMVGQWFPKLARLLPDGTFAARPFHAAHEFYADFGTYDVTMDVPHGTIVGATGERVATERRGDRDVIVHHARDVHDFAWAASPHFVEREVRAGHVKVRSLAYPGQGPQVERQLRAIQQSLPRFEARLGAYPYPGLTVVSPPEDALGAGGMEYPTLITTGGRFLSPPGLHLEQEVAIHELGHQWFYGLLASNEPDEAWLDEGLNTYVTGQIMDELYGPRTSTLDLLGIRMGYATLSRIARSVREVHEPVGQRSSDFASVVSYGTHVYYGTDLLMRTLAGRVGGTRVTRALARYAAAYRLRHPTTQDLLAILKAEVGDEPVHDLVEPVLSRGAWVDFAIAAVQSEPVNEPSGQVRRRGKRVYQPVAIAAQPERFRTSVLVTREGEVRLPVTVEVRFEDGTRQRVRWDGSGRWKRLELVGPSPGIGAVVDPDLDVPLDENLLNRARAPSGSGASQSGLWARLLYTAQTALQVLGP